MKVSLDKLDARENLSRAHVRGVSTLAGVIRRSGWVSPLLVRREGRRYRVVAGHRRLAALRELVKEDAKRWGKVEVQLLDTEPGSDDAVNVIENVARENLSPIELGGAIKSLGERHGYSAEDVAERLGLSASHARNLQRIAERIDPRIAAAIVRGHEDVSQAQLLRWAALPPAKQQAAWERHLRGILAAGDGEGDGTSEQAEPDKLRTPAEIRRALSRLRLRAVRRPELEYGCRALEFALCERDRL